MRDALSYALDMLPAMMLALPLWALGRGAYLWMKKAPVRWGRELLLLALILWTAGLLSQTVWPSNGYFVPLESVFGERTLWRMNLVPFRTIADYFGRLRDGFVSLFLVNFAGNILLFVPLGLLPPLLWRRYRGWRGAALPALCSLLVELAQIFTGRSVDVDDLILNALGGLLGWLLARLLLRPDQRKKSC